MLLEYIFSDINNKIKTQKYKINTIKQYIIWNNYYKNKY